MGATILESVPYEEFWEESFFLVEILGTVGFMGAGKPKYLLFSCYYFEEQQPSQLFWKYVDQLVSDS